MEDKKHNLITKKRVVITSIIVLLVVCASSFAVYKYLSSKSKNTKSKNNLKSVQTSGVKKDSELQKELATKNLDRLKDRINMAQKSGSLTKDQANKLLKKTDEMSKFYASLSTKPLNEQGKLVSDKRKELRNWANNNNIPTSYVSLMALRF